MASSMSCRHKTVRMLIGKPHAPKSTNRLSRGPAAMTRAAPASRSATTPQTFAARVLAEPRRRSGTCLGGLDLAIARLRLGRQRVQELVRGARHLVHRA